MTQNVFQLTRPARDATGGAGSESTLETISIHAPRVGRDKIIDAI